MPELTIAPISTIDANPFRLLGDYPYVDRKLEALQRSYGDVGMWPGVIARKKGNRFQLAFGHHRIEAARRCHLKEVALIIEDLNDERMLQYMGRENLEDYNADFVVMLETWEAAVKFRQHAVENRQPIDIANLLGWTSMRNDSYARMTQTAEACNAAHTLITGGYLTKDELKDLSVRAVAEIVGRTQSRIEHLEKLGKQTQRPAAEIESAKKHLGSAAGFVAKQYREGTPGLGIKDLGGRVEVTAYQYAREAKKQSPLFATFADAAVSAIERMLNGDATSEKLDEIAKFVPEIVAEEDNAALRRIDYVLGELGLRTTAWQKRLKPNKVTKLSPVKELSNG